MTRTYKSRAAWFSITLFLATGIVFSILRLTFDQFDADEFQHTHIAWLTAAGKLIFRDFFDAHGPVYAFLNGAILRLIHPAPGIELVFGCRVISAVISAATLGLTFDLARRLGVDRLVALTAAAILASLVVFRETGMDCRPDPLQNLLWLGGLVVLMRNLVSRRALTQVASGALFGLAVLTNTKAGLGPFSVLVFYVVGRRLHALDWRDVIRDLLLLLAGALFVYLPFVAFFAVKGGLREWHVFNSTWLLSAIAYMADSGRGWAFVKSTILRQLPFVLAAGAGFLVLVREVVRSEPNATHRQQAGLLMIAAFITSWGWLSNDYNQILMVTLPLWSVTAAVGLFRICAMASGSGTRPREAAVIAGLLASVAYMLTTSVQFTPFSEHPNLRFQKTFTKSFLRLTSRDEAPGVIWNACGGYIFNRNLQYYWPISPLIGGVILYHSGVDAIGQPLIDLLDQQQTRYIIGRDGPQFEGLPVQTRQYILANYDYDECLWTRREATDPS